MPFVSLENKLWNRCEKVNTWFWDMNMSNRDWCILKVIVQYMGVDARDLQKIVTWKSLPFWCWPLQHKWWRQNIDIIFMHIPKTAGTSILSIGKDLKQDFSQGNSQTFLPTLQCKKRFCSYGHMCANEWQEYPDLLKKIIAFVRNPFDRAVSSYLFTKSGGHGGTKELTLLMNTKYPTFESWILDGGLKKHGQDCVADFKQCDWLMDRDHKRLIVPYENIGRFENLDADWKRLFASRDSLPHKNESLGRDKWQKYYTNPLVVNEIVRLYKEDFEMLGYSKRIDGKSPSESERIRYYNRAMRKARIV